MAVLPTGIGPVTGGYQIERSLRFNSADSAWLNRTYSSAGNRKKWTISVWAKRTALGSFQVIVGATISAGLTEEQLVFNASDQLEYRDGVSGTYTLTSAVFRDPSAWLHIVYQYDSANATQADRGIFYVNGVRQAAPTNAIPLNRDSYINDSGRGHGIGRFGSIASNYLNGYLTEVNFINALTPNTTTRTVNGVTETILTELGQFNANTGVWEPAAWTRAFGTNGFYLKFADNSGTTSTTLGKDSSGNGNNWTPNNFSVTAGVGNDSLVDSPTSYGTDTGIGGEVRGNYCVLNPIVTGNVITPLNGNLNTSLAASSNAYFSTVGTTAVSSGKWYWECTVTARDASAGQWMQFGIVATTTTYTSNPLGFSGNMSNGYAYYNDGAKAGQGTNTAGYGATFTNNDVIGVALDLDAGTITFYKNGVSQGQAYSGISLTTSWLPIIQMYRSTGTTQSAFINFGQRPFEKWNGSAYVANTAPSGFKALCTQNLPTPTIGATSTTQANKYMDVTLYTGNATARSITNSGSMQPDFVWIKGRSQASGSGLFDVLRGTTKVITSNSNAQQVTDANSLTSFNSTGFSLGTDVTNNFVNVDTQTYVAWQWNAGGSNQTISVGQYATSPANVPSIASTVRANTTSGFSIATFNAGAAGNKTVGHGLGVAPNLWIVKGLSVALNSWSVGSSTLTTPASNYLVLNATSGSTSDTRIWANAAPTNNVFSFESGYTLPANSDCVAYCFAAVAGYSAFGSYTGNNSATDGTFVYLGFRPEFLIIKSTSASTEWVMMDSARNIYNLADISLYANRDYSEATVGTVNDIDFLSNGFKLRNNTGFVNASQTYIYAAFAETPFKYSLAR